MSRAVILHFILRAKVLGTELRQRAMLMYEYELILIIIIILYYRMLRYIDIRLYTNTTLRRYELLYCTSLRALIPQVQYTTRYEYTSTRPPKFMRFRFLAYSYVRVRSHRGTVSLISGCTVYRVPDQKATDTRYRIIVHYCIIP